MIAEYTFGSFWFLVLSLLAFIFGVPLTRLLGRRIFVSYSIPFGFLTALGIFNLSLTISNSLNFAYGALIVVFLLAAISAFRTEKIALASEKKELFNQTILVVLFFVMVGLIGFDFLGSDIRYFWGSGNPDMTDGVNGAAHFLKKTGDLEPQHPYLHFQLDPEFEDWTIRSQYLSISLMSLIVGPVPSLGLVYLLDLILIGCTFLALHFFFSVGLGLSFWRAVSISLIAPVTALYSYTYFAGHIGSLISGACLPLLMTPVLAFIRKRDGSLFETSWPKRLLLMVPILFLYLTSYPFTLIFSSILILIPCFFNQNKLILSAFISKASNKKIWLVSSVGLFTVATLAVFKFTEKYRLRGLTEYRAMGEFFRIVGFNFSMGITQVGGMDLPSYVGPLSFFASIILCLWVAWKNHQGSRVIILSVLTFATGLGVFFRFMVGDSYYFYKFIYTNQFIFIYVLALAFWSLPAGWMRKSTGVLFAGLCLLNLRNTFETRKSQMGQAPAKEYSDWSSLFKQFGEKGCYVPSTERNFLFIQKFYPQSRSEASFGCLLSSPRNPFVKINHFAEPIYSDPYKEVYSTNDRPFFDIRHYPIVKMENGKMLILKDADIFLYNSYPKNVRIKVTIKVANNESTPQLFLNKKQITGSQMANGFYSFEDEVSGSEKPILIRIQGQDLVVESLSAEISKRTINSNRPDVS